MDDRSHEDGERLRRIRNRLSTAGWGLLLVWTGVLILLPGELSLLWDVWLLGAGAIVLGAAIVAVLFGSRPDSDTWILGTVGFVSGLGGLLGVSVSVIGLGMLLFGLAYLIAVARASLAGSVRPPTAS